MDHAKWSWVRDVNRDEDGTGDHVHLQVDAPIETIDPANGIRKITKEGKAATSVFTLRDYDAATDTSLVECCPKTGRSHQLRLHLQWLGHPIVNDIQYGGRIIPSPNDRRRIVIEQLFNETIQNTTSISEMCGSVDQSVAAAAKAVHPLCSGSQSNTSLSERLSSTFTTAQLLQGGHAICLHALRYTLHFPIRKSNNTTSKTMDLMTTKTIELEVDLPPWATDATQCV
jgi:hypothetical protein